MIGVYTCWNEDLLGKRAELRYGHDGLFLTAKFLDPKLAATWTQQWHVFPAACFCPLQEEV